MIFINTLGLDINKMDFKIFKYIYKMKVIQKSVC